MNSYCSAIDWPLSLNRSRTKKNGLSRDARVLKLMRPFRAMQFKRSSRSVISDPMDNLVILRKTVRHDHADFNRSALACHDNHWYNYEPDLRASGTTHGRRKAFAQCQTRSA